MQGSKESSLVGRSLVCKVILSSPVHREVLRVSLEVDQRLWLGGGAIRNLVWDELTGRRTILEDFDLVYFDASSPSSHADRTIQKAIQLHLPKALKISVRNQARMHSETGEPPRVSLVDAIENWPETATSIAARVVADGALDFIAPYGFTDLLEMKIRPTPYHLANPESFRNRFLEKKWTSFWPELSVSQEASAVVA